MGRLAQTLEGIVGIAMVGVSAYIGLEMPKIAQSLDAKEALPFLEYAKITAAFYGGLALCYFGVPLALNGVSKSMER